VSLFSIKKRYPPGKFTGKDLFYQDHPCVQKATVCLLFEAKTVTDILVTNFICWREMHNISNNCTEITHISGLY